jgi:hypothetical protein
MQLKLKTVAGAVHTIELDSSGTVADIAARAEAAHGLRIKAIVCSGAVLAGSMQLAGAGLADGSTVVVLLHKAAAAPPQECEPEPETPAVEQQRAEMARLQRLERPAAGVPLGAWMGAQRVISDCHFRKTATEYDRKPGIKWLSCTEK